MYSQFHEAFLSLRDRSVDYKKQYLLAAQQIDGVGQSLLQKLYDYLFAEELAGKTAESRVEVFGCYRNDQYQSAKKDELLTACLHSLTDSSHYQQPTRQALADLVKKPEVSRFWLAAERVLGWIESNNAQIVWQHESDFPNQIDVLNDSPRWLFVTGDPALLAENCISIVGTRRPTPTGTKFSFDLAAAIAKEIGPVVSGMASGIDRRAHEGALSTSDRTIAVWAAGLDVVYPRSQYRLADAIAERGVIVTEMPPGTYLKKGLFPRRNRIVAALSAGLIVVEAAKKSGSLISARLANELNRDVFAVPGNVASDVSAGCNELIKQGAIPLTAYDDLIEYYESIGRLSTSVKATEHIDDNAKLQVVNSSRLELLCHFDFVAEPLELIAQRASMPVDQLMEMIVDMEFEGLVVASNGLYARR